MAKIDENAPAAAVFQSDETRVSVKQVDFVVPGLSVKDLLSAIPAHCTRRSAIRSGAYIVWDCALIYGIYRIADALEAFIAPSAGNIVYPHPLLHTVAWTVLWACYTFASGLVMTGLWVIAHECGHQAFSESKLINNTVGWILHSALGVPYHSWRITHAKHHASTGHLYQDQVFVPKTRSDLKLPAFDPAQEDIHGASVTEKVKAEMWDALGDSPIGAVIGSATYLLGGWPSYIMFNASGQRHYPKGTNHFKPTATMFKPAEYWSVVLSDLGILLWLAALGYWSYTRSFGEMVRLYGIGYLWVNHWLVAITFLQHTDPLLPHYRPPTFTFARGALTTFDRKTLGGAGPIFAWIGARVTHGIAETHVLHHVSSKIPHYHAWEASAALRARLDAAGVPRLEGRPVGWSEIYRVYKECKFVEDDGQVVFYKNAHGLAAARPVWPDGAVSDSGVDLQ